MVGVSAGVAYSYGVLRFSPTLGMSTEYMRRYYPHSSYGLEQMPSRKRCPQDTNVSLDSYRLPPVSYAPRKPSSFQHEFKASHGNPEKERGKAA